MALSCPSLIPDIDSTGLARLNSFFFFLVNMLKLITVFKFFTEFTENYKKREQQTTTKQRKTERKTRQLNQSRESTREVRGHHKATRSVRHAMRRESVEATLNNMSHELVILASPSSPPKNISPITDLRCCASSTDTNARKKVAADENRNYSGRPTKHLSKHRLQLSPPPDLTPLLLLIEPHKHPISY